MRIDVDKVAAVKADFAVDKSQLGEIAAAFRWDLEQGLKKSEFTSLKMLEAHIAMPEGGEKGKFLTLDFGGTNLRCELIELQGQGQYQVLRSLKKPLRCEDYDYTHQGVRAEELFDFIAQLLGELVVGSQDTYYLGHTFSFPASQQGIADAQLLGWTKEFAVTGVVGHNVNQLLQEALLRQGLSNIHPVALVNDTVAELLAAGYVQADTVIGAIYGTGTNCCYMEKIPREGLGRGIINLESGGFNKLMPNEWDCQLDQQSDNPGEQRLEKMVSGCYLGQLYSLLVQDLLALSQPVALTTGDMSVIMADTTATALGASKFLGEKLQQQLLPGEAAYLREVAEAVTIRSARLTAAVYGGILWHIGTNQPVSIAIDGSVYQHMPQVQVNVQKALYEVLGEDAGAVSLYLLKDGSSLGAAVAAAMTASILQ